MIELYQWLQGFTLPLPALIGAGVLLAIASNRNKPAGLPWQASPKPLTQPSQPKPLQTATPQTPPSNSQAPAPSSQLPVPNPQSPTPQPLTPRPSPQLPNLTSPKAPPQPSISFTIRKPEQNS